MALLIRLATALAMVLPGPPLPAAAPVADDRLELAVKANFLLRFAHFTEWPPQAADAPPSPFNLCIVGTDPFGATIDQLADGQQTKGRPTAIRRYPKPSPDMDCQVLYTRAKGQDLDTVLQAVAGKPVLTVAEHRAAASNAAIRFRLVDGRVRFVIDTGPAGAAGLQISSRLLALALRVESSAR